MQKQTTYDRNFEELGFDSETGVAISTLNPENLWQL